MKVLVAVAVSLAVIIAVSADEDKKAKTISFYKCLACSEDPAAREEIMKCKELKPEKCKNIADECKAKVMPDVTTPEGCWERICNDHDVTEQLYDCIMNHENRKDLNDEEKTQMKEYVNCAKKVDSKFCKQ